MKTAFSLNYAFQKTPSRRTIDRTETNGIPPILLKLRHNGSESYMIKQQRASNIMSMLLQLRFNAPNNYTIKQQETNNSIPMLL